jgi:hypothetical protein
MIWHHNPGFANNMDRFDAMRVFTRVAERRSFTLAAEDLRLPSSTVTDAVKQLEARLGVRLLQRTTDVRSKSRLTLQDPMVGCSDDCECGLCHGAFATVSAASECDRDTRPLMVLNVSAGTARFRQLSEVLRKTYAKRRETGKE